MTAHMLSARDPSSPCKFCRAGALHTLAVHAKVVVADFHATAQDVFAPHVPVPTHAQGRAPQGPRKPAPVPTLETVY